MNDHAPPVLAAAWIDEEVLTRHPDYTAVLIVATELSPGATSEASDMLLRQAEQAATQRLAGVQPHELPEIDAWRTAYAGFGVKPREARSSAEALMRRVGSGLPRIDRLTDVYNAISVLHAIPIGGEDLGGYVGPARLVVASGDEVFDTIADGELIAQTPVAGEIVWRDDAGVTCRRWNWRQCVRTRLTTMSTDALFIIDGLGPDSRARAEAAATDLMQNLADLCPAAVFRVRALPG